MLFERISNGTSVTIAPLPGVHKKRPKMGKKICKPLFRDLHFLCELFRSRIIKFYVIWLKNGVFRLFAHSFRPRPPFKPIFSFSMIFHSNRPAKPAGYPGHSVHVPSSGPGTYVGAAFTGHGTFPKLFEYGVPPVYRPCAHGLFYKAENKGSLQAAAFRRIYL